MKSTVTPAAGACPTRADLIAFDRGGLDPSALDAVGGHLAVCPHCLAHLAELSIDQKDTLQDFRRSLKAAEPEPFAGHPEYLRMEGRAIRLLRGQGLPAADAPPRACGQYRILEPIGRGGMGAVYKAEHTRLKRIVAIKLLSPGRTADPQAVARFQREMEAVGRLSHENVVRATDAGESDGLHYLVMELIEGTDLSRLVAAGGPLPVAEACELARRAARGLQAAHELGLVHRDVKPSNLILSAAGELKVLDFGLASLAAGSADPEALTRLNQVMGTSDYMAPEQWQSSHYVDTRADVYSLGCTLYFLLAGRAPFAGPAYQSPLDKMEAHLRSPVPPLAGRSDVPEGLVAVLGRMLAKRPDDRFATPGRAAEALAAFAHPADLVSLAGRGGRGGPDCKAEPTPSLPALVPPRRPGRAEGRRPLVAAALVAVMVAGVVLAVALLSAGPARPGMGQALKPGVVNDLMGRPPTEFHWYNPAQDSYWACDTDLRRVRVQAHALGLLSLGSAGPSGFTLDVGLRQEAWTGQVGVFFGGQKDAAGKISYYSVQLLHQKKALRTPPYRLQLDRGSIQPQLPKSPLAVAGGLNSVPLPNAPTNRMHVLHLRVTPRGLVRAIWDGVPCDGLIDGVRSAVSPEGEFGLICERCSVQLLSATVLPHK